MLSMKKKRIAVVGSGVSGLSAAWLCQRNGAHVTLYESDKMLGGHTLTDDSSGYPVDLGFQVYNLTTYPHLVGFFEELGVETEPSEMSFALSVDKGNIEWGSHGLDSVFAQRKNLISPTFLAMLYDVVRFGREAPEVLKPENHAVYQDMTLGDYLDQKSYSNGFKYNYVLPMCACVWSIPNSQVLGFPVQMLIRFWVNHHLLDIFQRPRWRVVKGRSREYVKRVAADLPDIRVGTPVTSVVSATPSGPVTVHASDGKAEYDAVILATHSDVSLRLVEQGAPKEVLDVLGAIPYNSNDIYLHSDASLMPTNRKTWASWNCIGEKRKANGEDEDSKAVCCTYWANRLQTFPAGSPNLFVTLNPVHPPAPETVHRRLTLDHPVFSEASVKAQQKIPGIQGKGGLYFAGAWCGYGFHEDGIKSAVAVVEALGGAIPWNPRSVSPKIGWLDGITLKTFSRFAGAALSRGHLLLVLPNGEEMEFGSKENALAAVPPGEEWRNRPPLDATVRVFDTAFFRKVILRHDTGMGESYMDGDYEVDDLGKLLAVATANAYNIEDNRGMMGIFNWLGDRLLHAAHAARSNTVSNSRRNIEEHYDAGNDMYKLFLDESMTYSCGIYSGPDCSLHQAQLNKLDALIEKAEICESDHVLEIGCGWGSFAMRAVEKKGCRVTGLTLSKEQLAEATARVKAAGLQDNITLLFCDYRDCPGEGTYDKIVSCEMIEAVGHEHLEAYFRVLGRMVKPGGKIALQVIAGPDERYEAYCNSSDFIREHIFPGGHLPSMGAMVEASKGTGLAVHAVQDIGPDYAVTLRAWRAAWEEKKEQVLSLGYSERFWRKYRFYFAYCEAAFDARYIHTFQVVWKKDQACTLTDADYQRSLERSKGHSVESASMEVSGARDGITQLLLAVYFFLAGIAVSSSPVLWLLPIATATCTFMFNAIGKVSALLFPFYRAFDRVKSGLWGVAATHLLFSLVTSVMVCLFLLSHPSALWLSPGSRNSVWLLPQALIAASTGFFGFVLWAEVSTRLYKKGYTAMLHYTILISLFFAAAYKTEHTAFLCATLLSEVNSVFHLAGQLAALAGCKGTLLSLIRSLDKSTFVAFRFLPHLIMGIAVVLRPSAFSSTGTYLLASGGMAYMNLANLRRAKTTLRFGPAEKLHAA